MRILIIGASGLVGKALRSSLSERGHELLLAGRGEPTAQDQIRWSIGEGFSDDLRLEGLDAIVHLAGESVSGLRWTDEKKRAIRDSRVLGTRCIVDAIKVLGRKPKVFVSGSAIGFYGDRGGEVLTEESSPGDTFLAKICREWEAESARAEEFGVRTVLLRTGIVLSKQGGALAAMLSQFKLGLGGAVGSGDQWMSWVSLEDEIGAIIFALENESLSGPINIVGPEPVTNRQFTQTLAGVLHRPAFLAVPGFVVNLVFGEMGNALLLDSARVIPKRLREAGYQFSYSDLKAAIGAALM